MTTRRTGAQIACAFAFVVALAILSGCATGAASTTRLTISAGPPAPTVTPIPATATATPDPAICGAWSAADGSIGQPVTAQYGAITSCALEGGAWIVTTAGLSGQPGVIGVERCAGNATCLDGQTNRGINSWSFYPAPHAGAVRLLGVASPGALLVDDAGHQLRFTIATGQYQAN